MHEHGIARDLWKVVLNEVEKNKIKKINKITIVLGEASGIEKDFLNHSFVDHIFKEYPIAENAVVEYEIAALEARCNVCGENIKSSQMTTMTCPYCGSNDIKIISGRDVYIKDIEAE